MPLYHFRLRDGVSAAGDEGVDLPDHRAARIAAITLVGDVLSDDPAAFWDAEDWSMDVTDAEGLILFRLTLIATVSPAG